MEKRYQVFVSSTYTDLIEERKEVTQAILKCNCFPAGMELFPASNKKQWTIIKSVIDDSDFYILIIAGRYGSQGVDDSGKKIGYTEMEFDYAVSTGKPIIVLLHDDPDSLPLKLVEKSATKRKCLEKFREKALKGRMVAFWSNKDQLHSAALNSLYQLKKNTPEATGWIKANSITASKNETSNFSEQEFILRLKNITEVDEQLEYINSVDYSKRIDLFNNKEFLKVYTRFLSVDNIESNISLAINTIPDSYKIRLSSKEMIINSLNIKILLNSFDNEYENNQFIFCVRLLYRLNYFKDDFAILFFNIIKDDTNSKNIIDICFKYLKSFIQSNSSSLAVINQIRDYAVIELKKQKHSLSTVELIELIILTCSWTESDYVFIYDIYFNNDKKIRKYIIDNLFEYYDSDAFITTPKIQRKFLEMCDDVYSWNDDEYTSNLLLYCLFNRTYDIFTIDEIYEKLNQFNNDVFYMFIWKLSFEEFGRGNSESYNVSSTEKARIKEIIKARNHPREKKLLEQF